MRQPLRDSTGCSHPLVRHRFTVQAAGDGGAIRITNSRNINIQNPAVAYQASTTISGTTFINNTAQNGGGISVTGGVVLVSNSAFEYNFAIQSGAGRGGALVGTYRTCTSLAGFSLADTALGAPASHCSEGCSWNGHISPGVEDIFSVVLAWQGGLLSRQQDEQSLIACSQFCRHTADKCGDELQLCGVLRWRRAHRGRHLHRHLHRRADAEQFGRLFWRRLHLLCWVLARLLQF